MFRLTPAEPIDLSMSVEHDSTRRSPLRVRLVILKVAAPFFGLNRFFFTLGAQLILQELVTHSIKPLLPLGLVLGAAAFAAGDRLAGTTCFGSQRPTLAADSGAALFDGDEATVSAPAAAVDSTPFIGIGRGRTNRKQNYCNDGRHQLHCRSRGEGQGIVLTQPESDGRVYGPSRCPFWVKSRHVQRTSRCPLSAESGLMHRSKRRAWLE